MDITITPAKLAGAITPPPSKSQAHRLIIAAALAGGTSVITNVAMSQDIAATLSCMRALGASAEQDGSTLTVTGLGDRRTPFTPCMCGAVHLDCSESGSTLRFLIPVALAVVGGAFFTGRGRLRARPQKPSTSGGQNATARPANACSAASMRPSPRVQTCSGRPGASRSGGQVTNISTR